MEGGKTQAPNVFSEVIPLTPSCSFFIVRYPEGQDLPRWFMPEKHYA